MRLSISVLFLAAGIAFAGGPRPLTVKEISLMLRTGYAPADVERETSKRHFLGPIGPEDEKALVLAGAPASFVAALKGGGYAVPANEVAAAQENISSENKRRAAQVESLNVDTQQQAKQAQEKTAAAALTTQATQHVLAPLMKGDLVSVKNGVIGAFDDQALEKKKLIALYFSAHWCGPCRKFTPQLVEFYNRVSAAHPEFEIVFVSQDHNAYGMETYMHDAQMPWPAIGFAKVADKSGLLKYAGSGIPCLVVVDSSGKVVSDSFAGTTYLGPAKVVADLDRMFAMRAASN